MLGEQYERIVRSRDDTSLRQSIAVSRVRSCLIDLGETLTPLLRADLIWIRPVPDKQAIASDAGMCTRAMTAQSGYQGSSISF